MTHPSRCPTCSKSMDRVISPKLGDGFTTTTVAGGKVPPADGQQHTYAA